MRVLSRSAALAIPDHVRVARVRRPRVSQVDHFYLCSACGQAVDRWRLADVFHHEDQGHAPLPRN